MLPLLTDHQETGLIHQLVQSADTTTRQKEYDAPSWSWASVHGQVTAFDDILDDVALAEVLEVHIELATDDEMG